MGVPKFFRWISERYPCLSEIVREYQIPEFDNLYLDMNGIIHTCSHPNDFDPHFRISEEKIFKDIFHYIEILFRIIQPRKLFFMAIDGVAPRAKMNQQRGRRFRSAKDAENLEKQATARGEKLPSEQRFDSNCITPGTVFMDRLHEQLKYFVTCKISTDALWQGVTVILSGHNTPGEGEHKIMDYIRYMRSQPGHDPNTRHCLYGLDADLIMLGLCTHEPHFSLLREEVKFGRKRQQKRASAPEETTFFLLHLSLMREYLEHEFGELKDTLTFPFDLERIIDDWVLMGFLVGNDFIPPLPDLHIINGALPMLYRAYIEVLPTLGGYINEGGTLNLLRFQKYMEKLSAFDVAQFRDIYADLKFFEAKTGRKMRSKFAKNSSDTNGVPEDPIEDKQAVDPELVALIRAADDLLLGDSSSNDEDDVADEDDVEDLFDLDGIDRDPDETEEANALFLNEFGHHKRDYYKSKLEYNKVTPEVLRSQAECYVRAIQWNLNYYYNGVCSWSWFYPHHYAPYISDVRNFSHLKLEFDLGEPFLPFQQLLAVLPALSKELLPEAYQSLMVDENSPLIKYYPSAFRTDLNGKKQEWEAVVLIPFIDEKQLLEGMRPGDELLSDDERRRNSHGPMLMYSYTSEDSGPYECPDYFPSLDIHHAAVKLVTREDIAVHPADLKKGLLSGVRLDVFFPGFPTLKHIAHTASMGKKRVKVFEEPSLGENMILRIVDQDKPDLKEITQKLLGKSLFVEWPHLIEAKVVAVSSKELRHALVESDDSEEVKSSDPQYSVEELKGNTATLWNTHKNCIQERYLNRLGVDIGTTHIIITAATIIGRKYVFGKNGKITLEKQWNPNSNTYALQATVKDITVHDPTFVQYKTLSEVFPPKSTVFLLAHPHYGSMGEVVDCSKSYARSGRVKVNMTVTMEPPMDDIMRKYKDMRVDYMPGAVAAQRLGISAHLLSRITGTIYIIHGYKDQDQEKAAKTNVGLNLKFNKKNEEIPGYTHKAGTTWYYSSKAVELVKSYMSQFPELFEYLNYHTGNDVFYESDVCPGKVGTGAVAAITNWLKEHPYFSIERQACGAESVDADVVQELENSVDEFHRNHSKVKTVTMQVKPYLLFKPILQAGSMVPDPSTTNRLLDRVVCVRQCYTVPLGLKGCITGIHKEKKEEDYLYDIVFDKPFAGGLAINCSKNRGYRMSRSTFVNLSHGQRIEQVKTVTRPSNAVQPPAGNFSSDTPRSNEVKQTAPLIAEQPSAFASWNNRGGMYQAPLFNLPKPQVPPFVSIPIMPPNLCQPPPPIPMLPVTSRPPPQQQQQQQNPPMRTQGATPANKGTSPSEFQALWSELQKAANVVSNNPPVSPNVAKTTAKPAQQEGSCTSTELLKKMLRIPDESPQQQQQRSSTRVSAPDVSERADTGVPTPREDSTLLLLHTFQSKGFGIPMYTYIQNPEDRSWTAQLFCMKQVFTGPSASNKGQAAENVAKMVLAFLGVPVLPPVPKGSTDGLAKPTTNNLPTPPQQWYQQPQIWTNHNQMHQPFWQSQPRMEPDFASWHHGSDGMRRPYNQQVGARPQQPYIPPFGPPHVAQQQNWSPQQTSWRQDNRAAFPLQQHFVPLQAVKQQHRTKTVTKQQEVPHSSPKRQQSSNGLASKEVSWPHEESSKDQPPASADIAASEKAPKPVVPRQRKCRIAANFSNPNPSESS